MAGDPESRFEIDEHPEQQQIEWRIERIGWALWALLILTALTGMFGTGPLSSARAVSPDGGLAAEYQRFDRRQADSELTLRVSGRLARGGAIRLTVSADFCDSVAVERIQPEPREVIGSGGQNVYVFPVAPGAPEFAVKIRFNPTRIGTHEYRFGVEDGPQVRLRTFVLP